MKWSMDKHINVLAIIHAFNVPLGTALAVYALWVMTQDEAVRILDKSP